MLSAGCKLWPNTRPNYIRLLGSVWLAVDILDRLDFGRLYMAGISIHIWYEDYLFMCITKFEIIAYF